MQENNTTTKLSKDIERKISSIKGCYSRDPELSKLVKKIDATPLGDEEYKKMIEDTKLEKISNIFQLLDFYLGKLSSHYIDERAKFLELKAIYSLLDKIELEFFEKYREYINFLLRDSQSGVIDKINSISKKEKSTAVYEIYTAVYEIYNLYKEEQENIELSKGIEKEMLESALERKEISPEEYSKEASMTEDDEEETPKENILTSETATINFEEVIETLNTIENSSSLSSEAKVAVVRNLENDYKESFRDQRIDLKSRYYPNFFTLSSVKEENNAYFLSPDNKINSPVACLSPFYSFPILIKGSTYHSLSQYLYYKLSSSHYKKGSNDALVTSLFIRDEKDPLNCALSYQKCINKGNKTLKDIYINYARYFLFYSSNLGKEKIDVTVGFRENSEIYGKIINPYPSNESKVKESCDDETKVKMYLYKFYYDYVYNWYDALLNNNKSIRGIMKSIYGKRIVYEDPNDPILSKVLPKVIWDLSVKYFFLKGKVNKEEYKRLFISIGSFLAYLLTPREKYLTYRVNDEIIKLSGYGDSNISYPGRFIQEYGTTNVVIGDGNEVIILPKVETKYKIDEMGMDISETLVKLNIPVSLELTRYILNSLFSGRGEEKRYKYVTIGDKSRNKYCEMIRDSFSKALERNGANNIIPLDIPDGVIKEVKSYVYYSAFKDTPRKKVNELECFCYLLSIGSDWLSKERIDITDINLVSSFLGYFGKIPEDKRDEDLEESIHLELSRYKIMHKRILSEEEYIEENKRKVYTPLYSPKIENDINVRGKIAWLFKYLKNNPAMLDKFSSIAVLPKSK